MADLAAATQSPSVSSTSSGAEPSAPGGAGGPGASPALGTKSCGSSCADSFVSSSSSQPVSLFSTSQETYHTDPTVLRGEHRRESGSRPVLAKEGKGKGCGALLDVTTMERPQGTSEGAASSPVSVAGGGHRSHPSIPASFPDRPAFLSEKAVQMEEQIKKDQESKNPNEMPSRDEKAAWDAGDKFSLLSARKAAAEQPKAEGIRTHSSSPGGASAAGAAEKGSPGSPFEVIIDKAAFDKEFKDAYKESAGDVGSWAARTDGDPPADTSEADDQVFPLRSRAAGRFPAPAALARQRSHTATAAALEEVSRCVSDMHSFTSEVLTWDLVPHAKQRSDRPDCTTKTTGPDMGEYNPKIPVINLNANTHQKTSVCSVSGSTPISGSASGGAESSPSQENAVRKSIPDRLSSITDGSGKGGRGSAQKQAGTPSEPPGSPSGKCVSPGSGAATGKALFPGGHRKGEVDWQSALLGEGTEADSSGESDDTVIEDITADAAFESSKVQAEKPVSTSSAIVKADERDVQKIPDYNRERKASESSEGTVSDSEPEGQPGLLERRPAGVVACSHAHAMIVMSGDVRPAGRMSDVTPAAKVVVTEDPQRPSAASSADFSETELSLTVTASAHVESLHEKSITYIDDSSPEDLVAAFPEAREKGDGNGFEATEEKTTDFRTTFPVEVSRESEAGGSEIKVLKSNYSEQNKGRGGSELLDGPSAAALDLEQERLTITALRELSERQGERLQDRMESPEEIPRQTFTFVPEYSQPQKSHYVLEHIDVKTGSDLGFSEKPTVIKETAGVDFISSLNKTELASKHVLARLLTDFSVHDLIFWRDVKKSGFVFGTTLIVLLSLAAFSVISVVSYLILALLTVTISFRVYRSVIQAVQKSEEGHPFKAYLDVDITLSSEAFHNYVNAAMVHVNRALKLLVRLFLVEDLVDSLKLAVFMWLMTYVGAVFNGITLLILADLLVFSVPIVYEKYKTQIDHYVGIVRDQTKSIVEKIQAKLPGIAKKKAE